jgi:formate-dependent phosphoribosylglycinamide formyltransferase (GAR transformylase)
MLQWVKRVSADRRSISAGRDVIGIPPDQLPAIIAAATTPLNRLTDEQRATIAALEKQLAANRDQIRVFFSIIDRTGIAPENMSETRIMAAMIKLAWAVFKIMYNPSKPASRVNGQ